jgi:hypothetical protein
MAERRPRPVGILHDLECQRSAGAHDFARRRGRDRLEDQGGRDFNQDGSPDLVWQHDSNGQIAIWFMDGPTMRAGVPLGPGQVEDLGWKIVGSGDFNRDGWQDLAWQHQGDGRISVWKMRGSALVEGDLMTCPT